MNDTSQYSFDCNNSNFEQYVVGNSAHLPVLVDFWAPWCGPCKTLMPLLTRLAEEYAGKFLLAKVNVDEQQELAQRYQVRSVPTVKILRHGEVVDEFSGALPEGELRRYIDGHIERESDRLLPQIFERFEQGEEQEALEQLRDLKIEEPNNPALLLYELQMLMTMGLEDEASTLIEAMPPELQQSREVEVIRNQLQLNAMAGDGTSLAELEQAVQADAGNSEARYQLALQLSSANDYEGALEQLLELMRRDRSYHDGAAQKAMVMIFETLAGSDDELVSRYRRRMASLLY